MNVVDRLADASFAWHMAEHMVPLFVLPPLLYSVALSGFSVALSRFSVVLSRDAKHRVSKDSHDVALSRFSVALSRDAKHRVSKGSSVVALSRDAKHRVSKGSSVVALSRDAKHRVSKGSPNVALSRRARGVSKGAVSLIKTFQKLQILAHPVVAMCIFVATLWVTHFSPLYDYAMTNAWAHAAEHALYFIAGMIFWLPVFSPPPLKPLPYPLRLLYLFVALPQGALLALAINGAQRPLYAHYTTQGLAAALADQHNAAAVMWIAGGTMLFAAFLITMGVWAAREA